MNVMALRTWQIYLGLFLSVYAAGLLFFWSATPTRPGSVQWPGLLREVFTRDTGIAVLHPTQRNDTSSIAAASIAHTGQVSEVLPDVEQHEPVTPLSTGSDLTDETRQEVIALSEQATTAAEPTERVKAIMKLRNAARTDDSVQALVSVLGADQSGQNRMFAIASLLSMARQGDEDGVIKAALRRATADQDFRVATRARQALESLSGVQVPAE